MSKTSLYELYISNSTRIPVAMELEEFWEKISFTDTQQKIINQLRENPQQRRELVRNTKIPRTTLYDNLNKLKRVRITLKSKKKKKGRGRPIIFWSLSQRFKRFLQIRKQNGVKK